MTTPLQIQQRPPIVGGLFSIAQGAPNDADWRNGVRITASPDDGGFAWNPLCLDDTGTAGYLLSDFSDIDEKPVSDIGSGANFFPITVGKIVQCGPGATQTTIGDIARETARGSLDRLMSKALAAALTGKLQTFGVYGGPYEEGASIADFMVKPDGYNPASPGNIRGTIQGLLDMVCACSNSDPVLHVPRAWMPQFVGDLVRWDPSTEKFYMGPIEVSFDCYPNEDPTGVDSTATDGSEVWIFATARPMIEVAPEDEVQVLTREQNNYKALVERHAIVAFDHTCVYGAKATVN